MSEPRILRLGTRSSNLALTQSRQVAATLESLWGPRFSAPEEGNRKKTSWHVEVVEISTTGDVVTDKALSGFGGAGIFVKELEQALLDNRIDIAVHSLKDLPARQPDGLILGAVVGREDVRDVFVTRAGDTLATMPKDAVVGSGSLRRRAQLAEKYPALRFDEIRGNVETRLRKILDGKYAATVLALAGLNRLGFSQYFNDPSETNPWKGLNFEILPHADVLTAPGQGALGIECRASDSTSQRILKSIHCPDVAVCVETERLLLAALGGGCHLPLGTLAQMDENQRISLNACLGRPDGSFMVRAGGVMHMTKRKNLAAQVAREIFSNGGAEIIRELDAAGLQTQSK